jgi:hypothetical protein
VMTGLRNCNLDAPFSGPSSRARLPFLVMP